MRAAAILALLLFAPPQEKGVDVVFVIDSSNSMARNDPEGLRAQFMQMTVDFMQGRAGDRVGVVQFAGWHETQARNVVVFPLTRLPEAAQAADFRKRFLEAVGKAEIFGSASDINVAFEKGLAEIQKQRGDTKNPYWVVVISDAAFNAVEPDRVRDEYRAKAAEMFGVKPEDADIDQINKAAREIFKKDVRPLYAGGGLAMSAINLSKKVAAATSGLQEIVGEGNRVGNLTEAPLKDLVVPMLIGSPMYSGVNGGFYGYQAFAGSSSVKRTVHVYDGAPGTRVVAFSRGGKLDVKVANPNSVPGFDASKVDVVGEGQYKVVHFRGAPAGDYDLQIDGIDKSGEVISYADLAWTADVKMVTPAEITAGQEMQFELSVTRGGQPFKDAALVRQLRGRAVVKSPKGEERHDVLFQDESKIVAGFKTDPLIPSGSYEVTIHLDLAPEGIQTPAWFVTAPQTFKASAITVLEAAFEKEEAYVGEPVAFTVKAAQGTPPPGLLSGVLMRGPEGEQRYPVAYRDGAWHGTVPTSRPSEFEITGEKSPQYALRSMQKSKLKVRARAMRLSGELVYDVKYLESGDYVKDVAVEVDMSAGEAGTLEVSGVPALSIDASKAAPKQTVKVKLSLGTGEVAEELGTATFTAKVGGIEMQQKAPVRVRFIDKGMKLFMKYLPYMIGALVLILLLLWFLLLARWKDEQIRPLLNENLDTRHLLLSLGGGRSAVGTPELPSSMNFKLSGMKFTSRSVRLGSMKSKLTVRSGDKESMTPFTLSHGDVIYVDQGEKSLKVVYFEHEPTPEELKAIAQRLNEEDNLYIEAE